MPEVKNPIDVTIQRKKNYAILHYLIKNNVDSKGEAEAKENEKLNTILDQIAVCERMLISLSLETIIDWLENKTIREIEREAHTLKFA